MAAAIALSLRATGLSTPNPNVGCVLTSGARIIGRGWTELGGRPHAEAMALTEAGQAARGAAAFVTLEPCAHASPRGPSCADSLIAAGVARVVYALVDPDPRTAGRGIARLQAAGIETRQMVAAANDARQAMAGWLSLMERGRPYVTLKLATSLDGCIARADGESRWITGPAARAHGHLERAQSDMILVGRGTLEADAPTLDVRLAGLEDRSPRRAVLTSGAVPDGWECLRAPNAIAGLIGVQRLLIEGGGRTAAAFLKAGLVDRVLLYRAPMLIGGGLPCLADIGLASLSAAHGRWVRTDARPLGIDTLEVYEAL